MRLRLPYSLLSDYGAANDAQILASSTDVISWQDILSELPVGDRFCLGRRGHRDILCGGGRINHFSGVLPELGNRLNERKHAQVQLVLVEFPQSNRHETPVVVWEPKWVYQTSRQNELPIAFLINGVQHSPDLQTWRNRVQASKTGIEKVVLSRCSLGACELAPMSVAGSMFNSEPNGYRIFIETGPDCGLISVSPERLFLLADGQVSTEAIAGTDAIANADELLASSKNRIEHHYVQKWIQERLESLGAVVSTSETEILRLSQLAHLRTPIQATGDFSHADLISALFPTPAVAGVPQDHAIRWINSIEVARGLYSGLFGIVTPEYSEFVVLIRYCEWKGRQFLFRAGAGIVADSDPDLEWRELNQKLKSLGVVV